jgi:hypothetical protein
MSGLPARVGRYVILRHEPGPASERPLHWDLMLETPVGLRTWALMNEPCVNVPIDAAELPLHRVYYLTYEGPVSGARGIVTRWDEGTYHAAPQRTGTADASQFRAGEKGSPDTGSPTTASPAGSPNAAPVSNLAAELSTLASSESLAGQSTAGIPPFSFQDDRTIRVWIEGQRLRGILEIERRNKSEFASEAGCWIVRFRGEFEYRK